MADEQRRSIRQRLAALVLAGIGSAAASVISYATAIYQAANPPPLHAASLGETIDTGRWHIKITGARLSDKRPTESQPTDPKTYLLVDFEADNRSAVSAFMPTEILAPDPPLNELAQPLLYLAKDRSIAGPINPGLPEKLTLAWEVPQGYQPPEKLRLLVGSQIYKKRDNLYGASNWFDRDRIAAVNVDVAR